MTFLLKNVFGFQLPRCESRRLVFSIACEQQTNFRCRFSDDQKYVSRSQPAVL